MGDGRHARNLDPSKNQSLLSASRWPAIFSFSAPVLTSQFEGKGMALMPVWALMTFSMKDSRDLKT
jgi:hypothetical protein